MSEEQDDLTLVYMYGFKNGEQSMKAEIVRLRAEIDRRDELIQDVIESWDWWQVDTYDRCASVISDAIRDARAALAREKTDG
jgi:hypothetical protein